MYHEKNDNLGYPEFLTKQEKNKFQRVLFWVLLLVGVVLPGVVTLAEWLPW